MRVFIAILLPQPIIETLVTLQEPFRHNRRRGNLTSPRNLHLTLAFIGEADGKLLDRIDAILEDLAFEPFTLSLDKMGSFHRKDGAVWWAGLQKSPALIELQRTLTDRLREAEIPFDAKPFQPHITLVRQFSPAHDPMVLPTVTPQSFKVASLALMRSHRVNDELTYSPLAIYFAEDNDDHA